eukprot:SAG31_NODE_41763_length_274_cov_1.171429_1_plen_65_part_10
MRAALADGIQTKQLHWVQLHWASSSRMFVVMGIFLESTWISLLATVFVFILTLHSPPCSGAEDLL